MCRAVLIAAHGPPVQQGGTILERGSMAGHAERCWKEPLARRTMEPGTFRERYGTLSARQRTILLLRCQGRTNEEVAGHLFVQEKTVKNHMTRILAQMGLRGRRGSAALCSQINAVTGKSR